jgi:hypothetical protein
MAKRTDGNGHRGPDEHRAIESSRQMAERLGRENDDPEEQLRLVQALRNENKLSNEEAFFYISFWIERIIEKRIKDQNSPELNKLSRQIEGLESLHEPDEDVPELQTLHQEYVHVKDILHAATLDEFGEMGMAAMYRDSRAEYDARREQGRHQVFGPLPKLRRRRRK